MLLTCRDGDETDNRGAGRALTARREWYRWRFALGTSLRGPGSGECPGDERQHEPCDDDRHPRVVQPVPAPVLLGPVSGVVLGRIAELAARFAG